MTDLLWTAATILLKQLLIHGLYIVIASSLPATPPLGVTLMLPDISWPMPFLNSSLPTL